jgi:hypothetical protein
VPGPTQVPDGSLFSAAYGAVTLYGRTFQIASAGKEIGNSHMPGPTTPPGRVREVWAMSAFARRY